MPVRFMDFQVNQAKINLLEVAENIKARRRANKRLSEQMAEKVITNILNLIPDSSHILTVALLTSMAGS